MTVDGKEIKADLFTDVKECYILEYSTKVYCVVYLSALFSNGAPKTVIERFGQYDRDTATLNACGNFNGDGNSLSFVNKSFMNVI